MWETEDLLDSVVSSDGVSTLRIKVRLFASYREKANTGQFLLELPDGASVKTLVRRVTALYPNLTSDPNTLVVAINQEYQDHSFYLSHGDEAALIPPVSGGT